MKTPASRRLRVLGIMSGTSIDSVDLAVCDCAPDRVNLVRHWQVPLPRPLRRRLHAAARNEATTWELGQLHHDLGRFYAVAARSGLSRTRLDGAGVHGQTVFHHPRPPAPATWQLGEPAWLAEALRVPVISNFRAGDVAAGGQGAPLATLFHRVAFGRPGEFVCVNNLGGISNVTALDWRRSTRPRVLAFDTGPANVLLDLAARHFSEGRRDCDRNGVWARRGVVHEPSVVRWLTHPYFRRRPPKSTGREEFGEPFWKRVLAESAAAGLCRNEVLTSLTEFTARSLALNYRLHLGGRPDRVILAGGGASNPELVRRIAASLGAWHPAVEVASSESLGWPSPAIEAAAFALLAAYRLWGLPANLPATTGARRAMLLGQITAP